VGIYETFAVTYTQGPYPRFSLQMAELLPYVLTRMGHRPRTILDVACGEGAFAVQMAEAGYRVTGVDRAPRMIEIARGRAEFAGVEVRLVEQDMRALDLPERYDLVTCWFDSLNYLLTNEDLTDAFTGVRRCLAEDGLFLFDMNTLYGLAVEWQRNACYVQQDTPDILEIHRPTYNYEERIATLQIDGFLRDGPHWLRYTETHQERGYRLAEIRRCLSDAGLEEVASWGSLREFTPPLANSGRVWFAARAAGPASAGHRG